MKKSITFLIALLFAASVFSQSKNFQIKGLLQDSLENPLLFSTVLLLEEADSTMVSFTRSEMDGSFKFKDVAPGKYIVKSTFVGFIPLHTKVSSKNGDNVDLGELTMNELAAELMEVVIKAAKAQIKMRGDTIEYDVSTFKVPEGSSVEELLRRLPGMEVDRDGSLKSDGKDITRVTVDGKSFFGNNPKAATQNLPSESISKVQVFDKKTEEEEITGATSESQEKTMNLELKDDFKSGGFGRVVAGVGNENRKELKGNFNRFNEKIQFSIVGVGNNTGRNGLSWDDYQDFLGSQSFDFDSNLDYGFGSGGGRTFYFSGGNGLESSIQSIFFQGRRNEGLPENYNGGANFNYDHNKLKISSVYYYNQAGLTSESNGIHDRFFPDFVQKEESLSTADDVSKGHRLEFNVEKELDSLHSIKFEFNGAAIDQEKINEGSSDVFRNSIFQSQGIYKNTNLQSGYLGNGAIIFRKKFKKKGRRIGINASYLFTQLEDDQLQFSTTNFYDESGDVQNSLGIDQNNDKIADKGLFKANALYVEPLSKRFFFQTFYNYSNRNETGDRQVFEANDQELVNNGFLSRSYENDIDLNRVGSSLRYSHEGFNITTGLAYQNFDLSGVYSSFDNTLSGTIDRTFDNWIPHLSISLTPVRNLFIRGGYTRVASEPRIEDLQPIVDNTHPLFITEGNPELTPVIKNEFSTYINRSFPASGIRLSLNGRFSSYDNYIGRDETIDENLITTYRPVNIERGKEGFFWSNINLPIIRNKFVSKWTLTGNMSNLPAFVNGVENNTKSVSLRPRLNIEITPLDNLAIYLSGFVSNSNTSYDISTSQDQKVTNKGIGLEVNAKLIEGFYLNSSFDYNKYTNDRFGLTEEIPILNASIYKQFLKGNKAELRFSIYDAFNQNVGFYQGASGNGVSQRYTNALGRYGMLSLIYNIKGLKAGVKKDGHW